MKRFYKEAAVSRAEGGYSVTLDGRAVKTQGGEAQVVPSEELAELLAREWRAQGDEIDPRGFPHRDMADYAIDVIEDARGTVIEKLLAYAETDTLCYRADPEDALWRRQQEVWEPLVAGMEGREGVKLERVSGVVARPLQRDSRKTLARLLEAKGGLELAALQTLTGLAASLCVGLAALEPGADGEALWDAANLEEDWQAERWGIDEEAERNRAARRAGFLAAMDFARAARV